MRLFAQVLFIGAYMTGLIYATLILSPQADPTPNLEPLQTISACWSMGGETLVVNLLGNLILTAPLGIIGPWFWDQARCGIGLRVLLCGFAVSIAIEATQYACDHRMADVDDVLLNTIGAGMGFGAIRGFETVRRFGTEGLWPLMMGTTERGGMDGRASTIVIDHPD